MSGDGDESLAEATGGDAREGREPSPEEGGGVRATLSGVLTVVLALALVVSVGAVVYVAVNPPQTGETFTEFYVLGPEGNASDYPTTLAPGESGEVIVGVSNHERRDVQYRVAVTWNGTTTQERQVTVPQGETREVRMNLTAPEEPGEYRVSLDLYLDEDGDTSYRNLRLFVQVQEDG